VRLVFPSLTANKRPPPLHQQTHRLLCCGGVPLDQMRGGSGCFDTQDSCCGKTHMHVEGKQPHSWINAGAQPIVCCVCLLFVCCLVLGCWRTRLRNHPDLLVCYC
jgi:hypothetical protein